MGSKYTHGAHICPLPAAPATWEALWFLLSTSLWTAVIQVCSGKCASGMAADRLFCGKTSRVSLPLTQKVFRVFTDSSFMEFTEVQRACMECLQCA